MRVPQKIHGPRHCVQACWQQYCRHDSVQATESPGQQLPSQWDARGAALHQDGTGSMPCINQCRSKTTLSRHGAELIQDTVAPSHGFAQRLQISIQCPECLGKIESPGLPALPSLAQAKAILQVPSSPDKEILAISAWGTHGEKTLTGSRLHNQDAPQVMSGAAPTHRGRHAYVPVTARTWSCHNKRHAVSSSGGPARSKQACFWAR